MKSVSINVYTILLINSRLQRGFQTQQHAVKIPTSNVIILKYRCTLCLDAIQVEGVTPH